MARRVKFSVEKIFFLFLFLDNRSKKGHFFNKLKKQDLHAFKEGGDFFMINFELIRTVLADSSFLYAPLAADASVGD